MNILRIVYDWPEPWSGLAPGPYFLTRAQGLLGHKIVVLTGGLTGKSLLKLNIIEKPEKNVTVIKLPRALTKHTGPFLTTSPCALILYLLIKLFWRVDILHGHGHVMLWINMFRNLFPFLDRTKYIAHFHNCSKARYLSAVKRNEKFSIIQKYFEVPLDELSDRLSLKVCDLAIVVSTENKEELVRFYKKYADKIMLVENGVPTHIFKPSPTKQLSINKEILGVGVISPRKGIHVLVEALKYLPNYYYLRWVGQVENQSYKKELDELATNLNVHNRIKYEGYIPNLDMPRYFQNANVFIIPSTYEGFPKVVLEALACGLPVLASGFKSLYRIIGLTYLSSFAPKIVAREIKQIVEGRSKVDIDFINRIYSWDAKAKEIDIVYKEVVNRRSLK